MVDRTGQIKLLIKFSHFIDGNKFNVKVSPFQKTKYNLNNLQNYLF